MYGSRSLVVQVTRKKTPAIPVQALTSSYELCDNGNGTYTLKKGDGYPNFDRCRSVGNFGKGPMLRFFVQRKTRAPLVVQLQYSHKRLLWNLYIPYLTHTLFTLFLFFPTAFVYGICLLHNTWRSHLYEGP